jgi:hypothetical protein
MFFFHGDLHEEMYMEQPLGYVNQTHPNLVYRLKKALYNLKQTPRAWSDKIGQYLITSGFQTSNADFSLYVKKTNHGIIIIVIYVDDLIVTRDSDADIFYLKKLLKQKFEMKCESWIIIPQIIKLSSIVFLSINDLNPNKPPSNNY